MYKLIIFVVLSSCSVNNPKLYYLKSENNNKNIVFFKKIPVENVLNFIKPLNNNKKYNPISKDSIIFLENKFYEQILSQNIKNESIYWKEKDFKKTNVQLLDFNLFDIKKPKLKPEDGLKFYSFSKEIFFNEKKNCLFYFTKSNGYNFIDSSGVIFMKKKGKIWEVYGLYKNTEIQ